MQKQVRITDEERGIVQVTTYDERWYAKQGTDPVTGLPTYNYVPSVTWVTGHYPKGIEFYQWLAKKGWDESQAIKEAAASKGSKIHKACENLLQGETVAMDAEYADPKTGVLAPLTVEEYYGIMTFAEWYKNLCAKNEVEVLGSELVIWNDEDNYSGTTDLILRINGRVTVIDIKTGANIWPEHTLQLSAYKRALDLAGTEVHDLAILQLGYKRNKNGYKYTEINYNYELFLAAKTIWANECASVTVHQRDYPLAISLGEAPTLAQEVVDVEVTVNLEEDTATAKTVKKRVTKKATE